MPHRKWLLSCHSSAHINTIQLCVCVCVRVCVCVCVCVCVMGSNSVNLGDVRNGLARTLVNGVKSIYFSSEHQAKVHAAQIMVSARKVEEETAPLKRKLSRLQNEESTMLENARHYVQNEVYVRNVANRIKTNRKAQDDTRRELRRIEKKGKIALDMKRALDAGEDARTAILSAGTKRQQGLLQQDLKGLSSGLSSAYEASADVKDLACDIEQQFREEGINSLREDFQDDSVTLETELEEEVEQERHAVERAEKEQEARLKREEIRNASGGSIIAQRYDVDSIMGEIGFSRDVNLAGSMPNPPGRIPAHMKHSAHHGQQRRVHQKRDNDVADCVPTTTTTTTSRPMSAHHQASRGVNQNTDPPRSLRGWSDINAYRKGTG